MGSSTAWNRRDSSRRDRGDGRWAALATTSGLAFLAFLNATVLNAALPDLAGAYGATVDQVSWAVTVYATALAAGLIASGRLADAIGRRKVLICGTGLFALASIGSALATGPAALIAARAVQGTGAALVTPASFGVLLAVTPEDHRARAIGVWSAAAATSAFVGPPVGGAIVDLAGWQAPFVFAAVAASVLFVLAVRLPQSRESNRPRPAMRGVLLGGAAVTMLVLATVQSAKWGWTDPRTLLGLTVGGAGVGVGVLGAGGPGWRVVDPELLRLRAFAVANALSILFGFAAFSWLLAAPLFAATVWRWDALAAALSVAPGAIVAALAAWAAGRLPRRGHAWAIVLGGAALMGMALVLAGALDQVPRFLTLWLPAGIVSGIAIGLVLASLSAVVASSVPARHFAQGAGINMTARQLGGALGVAAVAALVGTSGGSAPAEFTTLWLVIASASAIAAAGGTALLGSGERAVRQPARGLQVHEVSICHAGKMNPRSELGAFVRARRDRTTPSEVGLSDSGQRRVPGLRREELATLADTSPDYLRRLEQGRVLPSNAVLDSLADALRADPSERAHLQNLADRARGRQAPTPADGDVSPTLRRLLDALEPTPAVVLGRRCEVLAWNRAGAALDEVVARTAPKERNVARRIILDPRARDLYPEWDALAQEVADVLRLNTARFSDDRQLAALVDELLRQSPEFRRYWDRQGVFEKSSGVKVLDHPRVGRLELEYESFEIAPLTGQVLIVYTAAPDSATAEGLEALAQVAPELEADLTAAR
jgi:MFS family permease/transcriptional regulator with XRE-family HTH domain